MYLSIDFTSSYSGTEWSKKRKEIRYSNWPCIDSAIPDSHGMESVVTLLPTYVNLFSTPVSIFLLFILFYFYLCFFFLPLRRFSLWFVLLSRPPSPSLSSLYTYSVFKASIYNWDPPSSPLPQFYSQQDLSSISYFVFITYLRITSGRGWENRIYFSF